MQCKVRSWTLHARMHFLWASGLCVSENGVRIPVRLHRPSSYSKVGTSFLEIPVSVSFFHLSSREKRVCGGVLESLQGGTVKPERSVTLADKIGAEAWRGDTHTHTQLQIGWLHEENHNDLWETSSEIISSTHGCCWWRNKWMNK